MRRLQWSNTVLPSRPHPPLPPPYFLPIRPAPLRVRSRPLRSAREPCGFGRGFAASSPLGSSAPSPEDPAPAIRVPSERSDPFWSSRVQLESPRSSRVQFESPRSSQVQSESPRSSQVQAESPRSSRVQLESPRPLQTIKKIRRLSIAPILADQAERGQLEYSQAERGQLEYSQAERGQAERGQVEPKAPQLPSLPSLPLSRSRTATSAHQPGLESVSQRPLERPRPPPAGRPDTANRGRRGAARGRPESCSRASRPGPRAPPGAMPGLGGELPGEDRKATHTIGPVGHDCIHLVCCAEVGSEGAVTGWRTIRQWSASGPPNGG